MTMSDQPTNQPTPGKPPTPFFNLGPGLLEYYASQAEIMLAQYNNINRLLGLTHHWTHPGEFCEILFRDFLRKFLPPSLSAEKGFFYGRAMLEGKDTHCPEIDILIHDTQQCRPIFRMGDFVIVQPQAVRGMIQVKRTFSKGQVRRGLKNVVTARQHLLNVLWKDNPKGWSDHGLPPRIFSGIVGFEDKIEQKVSFYSKYLLAWSVKHRAYDRPGMERTSMYVLPSFIGSLRGAFVTLDGPCNYWNQRYYMLDSQHGGANICIQAFLAKMYNVLGEEPDGMPPFSFPHGLKPIGDFHVVQITEAVLKSDDTLTLLYNDKRKAHYRKADGPVNDVIHLIADDSSPWKVTDRLKTDLIPQELFVQRPSCVERYERIKVELPAKATS